MGRRAAVAAVLAAACGGGVAHGHELGNVPDARTLGPTLALSATDVLSRARLQEGRAPGKLTLLVEGRYTLTPAQKRAFRVLGRGRPGRRAVVHRGGRVLRTRRPAVAARSTGRTAGEPTLGVTPDGTLFFVGLTTRGVPSSAVLRSRDQGRTWEAVDPLVPGTDLDQQTLDPFLYVDQDTGRVFNLDLLLPCSAVSYSDDEGDSWAAGAVCNHTDHQNLFTGPAPAGGAQPSGYPNVVYYCSIDGGALGAYGTFTGCSRSLDGGRTFLRTAGPPFVDQPGGEGGSLGIPGHCTGATGHGAVAPDGTVYLPRGWCGQPYVAVSRDMGDTWERVQVAGNGFSTGPELEEHEANVAVDPQGNAYYTWVAADRLPYLAVSRDGGRTWSEPVMVAPPGVNEAWNVFVDAGDPGRIAISYMGTTNSPGPPYCVRTTATSCTTADGQPPKPATAYAGTTWNGYMAVSTDALARRPSFETATVNDPADPMLRGTCGPLRCQQAFDFLDVVVGPDGAAYAAFVDACTPSQAEGCAPAGIGLVGRMEARRPLVGSGEARRRRAAAPQAGSVKRNTLPPPSASSTHTRPPWPSTTRCTTDSPMPVPP